MKVASKNPDEKIKNIDLLKQAIISFNSAASSMERSYQDLERQVRDLNIELKYKNEELEKNLREREESERYLHCILESLTAGVIVVDMNGQITISNRAAEELTGIDSQKAYGKRLDKVFPPHVMKLIKKVMPSVHEIKTSVGFETTLQGKDKKIVNICVSPLKDEEGNKHGAAISIQDITRMKRLEERASRAERLAAMGEMAANIAHEIRNPLGSIELFASLLKKDLEDMPESKVLAEHICSGVMSINNIISNLLLFIKPHQRPDFRMFDIRDVITESMAFTDHMAGDDQLVDIVIRFSEEPTLICGDFDLLKQVVLNLVLNAFQAMPDGGTLVISTKRSQTTPNQQDMVEVTFEDSGKGISEQDLSSIFDPFFTTKEKGTGLGLAIVHNILKMHNGTIDISSTVGKGTICTVRLPGWKGGTDPRPVQGGSKWE